MFSRNVRTVNTGKEMASCLHVSRDSHQMSARGGGLRSGVGGMRLFLLTVVTAALLGPACDPIVGTGPGMPPDPGKYIRVDADARAAVVVLIAGYPATDNQFNYNGYGNGDLLLRVPIERQITIQCENHGTVPNSCAVVSNGKDTRPLEPGWSTPDPRRGLDPGQSASFVFIPSTPGSYRIASLVGGNEASGMW